MADSERVLTRDVGATVIPAGDKINLPEGSDVVITHRLGGNFTVTCDWGMFRINGEDADALGEEVPEEVKKQMAAKEAYTGGAPDEELIWEQLRSVFDPEIPVNIVDLGLVYNMGVKEKGESVYDVEVAITLTAPGCGMGPAIAEDAKTRIENVPGVNEATVEIVWDPPWTQDMISEEGKMELGMI